MEMEKEKQKWLNDAAKKYEEKVFKAVLRKSINPTRAYQTRLIKSRIDFVFHMVALYFGIPKKTLYTAKRQKNTPPNFIEIRGLAFSILSGHYKYSRELLSVHTKFSEVWISKCIYMYSISTSETFTDCENLINEIKSTNL